MTMLIVLKKGKGRNGNDGGQEIREAWSPSQNCTCEMHKIYPLHVHKDAKISSLQTNNYSWIIGKIYQHNA